jgi:hypothetical protein
MLDPPIGVLLLNFTPIFRASAVPVPRHFNPSEMALIEEIVALANGAKFYRTGLHIHCFGGSHDVKDPKMSQDEIVSTAIFEGLDIIAVTDRNETKTLRRRLRLLKRQG